MVDPVLRVFTDFNARTEDDECWLLQCQGAPLELQIDELNLREGDKILLYQDEDDFEVSAVMYFKHVDTLKRQAWVAVPDWSTISRKA